MLTQLAAVPSPRSLGERRAAIAAALRAVRDEPVTVPVIAPVSAHAAPAAPPPPAALSVTADDLARLAAQVRRLAERLERVDQKVDLIRDGDEEPLAWPVPVTNDSRLEVPPLEVSRKSSPAFDVLLGAPKRQAARKSRRDSA